MASNFQAYQSLAAAALLAALALPAAAQTFAIPASSTLAQKVDLGLLSPGPVDISALGYVELAANSRYFVFADGALPIPYANSTMPWTVEGGPNPTFAGGDGVNHYSGGGTNWQGTYWNELGVQSTDTLNPATIRFGTLVGTFNPTPAAADWFVLGRHTTVNVPAGGAHLYAAVSDCSGCYPDNALFFTVTLGSRLYSLRDDFDSNRNPSGPWSYGYRLATSAPGTFTRFSAHYGYYQQVIGGWQSTDEAGESLPGIARNFSPTPVSDGPSYWAGNECNAHPGTTRDAVARFTAPDAGTYRVSGSFRGLSNNGTTTTVLVQHGAALLFSANVQGFLDQPVEMPVQQVNLSAGDTIDLTVTKGVNGNYFNDSTGLSLIIEKLQCLSVTASPADAFACAQIGSAPYHVTATGTGPFTYQWQIETSPNVWQTMGNDPGPLPCGGGSFAYATPLNSPNVTIGVHICPGVHSYRVRCLVSSPCGSAPSNPARYLVSPADVGSQGGIPGADGLYDNNDFVVFINHFFTADSHADLGKQGGLFGGDGFFDNNDFVVFINQFFTGC